nr:MAG TPA: hypothetical protein [Caudoviricetes sp.]
MKLIDILVQELPKRGGWSAKASHAVYAKRFSRVLFTKGGAPVIVGDDVSIFENDGASRDVFWVPGVVLDCEEPIDYTTSIITREQYEAALAAKNDGWIEWGGGECPVPCGTAVDVKHRCGAVSENQQAWPKHHKESDVVVNPFSNAGQAFWRHENSVVDIIAYRLHNPQEVTEADDETELNECICQDVAQVWSGDGLPQAGCECEYQYKVHGSEWHPLECVAVDGKAVFGWSNNTPVALQSNTHNFRPIRSEADKKGDAAVEDIDYWLPEFIADTPNELYHAKKIYDAIAAGKVRGVKLED